MRAAISLKEFAESQGKSEKTIRRMIKKGTIGFIKINGRYGFLPEHIDDFYRRHSRDATTTNTEAAKCESDAVERLADQMMGRFEKLPEGVING